MTAGRPSRSADVAKRAAGSSVYKGRTFYFCSSGCKATFDRNPVQFAK